MMTIAEAEQEIAELKKIKGMAIVKLDGSMAGYVGRDGMRNKRQNTTISTPDERLETYKSKVEALSPKVERIAIEHNILKEEVDENQVALHAQNISNRLGRESTRMSRGRRSTE